MWLSIKFSIKNLIKIIDKHISELRFQVFGKQKPKIFCIGQNKTGTTSLKMTLVNFGFKVGNQVQAEMLLPDYKDQNWKKILDYCSSAEAFQDVPFSLPGTWRLLYSQFPKAKFILTVRPSDSWYRSITSFHSKKFGKDVLTDPVYLTNVHYRYNGFLKDYFGSGYQMDMKDPYNKEKLIEAYESHNNEVIEFFRGKTNFLVIDVADSDSYSKLSKFLNKPSLDKPFPHVNKT